MYEMQGRIRFSEVGPDEKLTPFHLINYLQDCSTFHSEDVGAGVGYLLNRHRAWLVSGWQIDINKMPSLGDRVKVYTWPYGFRGYIGYRNYMMQDEDGQILVAANSAWILMDLENRSMTRLTQEYVEVYDILDKLDMEYLPRKISIPTDGKEQAAVLVGKERLDPNGHMNNGQYISLAAQYLPGDMEYDRIRTEYKKEVRLGMKVLPVLYKTENSSVVVLKNEEADIFAVVEFEKRKS